MAASFTPIQPPARPALAIWAVVAILLIVFSYLFTLALAAACVYFPFILLMARLSQNTLLLFVGGIVISIVLVWSLIPRRDTFTPPGPRLSEQQHPRLFAEIRSIAASLKERAPAEVYLLPDTNAWVAERGGVLGFGSRRVMGLGLPLIRTFDILQFRATLAHEFAHYYGGDTRLWPLIHKTNASIARTIENLGSDDLGEAFSHFWVLGMLYAAAGFLMGGYWTLFLYVTRFISRKHEYRADELAAYIAGPDALIEGLKTLHGTSGALPAYVRSELQPMLRVGFRPPVADGFARFLAAPHIASQVTNNIESALQNPVTKADDTHPPLAHRVAALRRNRAPSLPANPSPAIALLDNIDQLEVELLAFVDPDLNVSALKPVSWERIGSDAYMPYWRSSTEEYRAIFTGYTVGDLPILVSKAAELSTQLRDLPGSLLVPEQRAVRFCNLLTRAFGVALFDHGWTLHIEPGLLYFENGEKQIEPLTVVQQMRAAQLQLSEWHQRCQTCGISEMPLIARAAEAAT